MNNVGNISASVPSKTLLNDSLNPVEPLEMHHLWLTYFFILNTAYKLYNTSYCLPLTNAAYGFIIPIETTKNRNLLTSNALVSRSATLSSVWILTSKVEPIYWILYNADGAFIINVDICVHEVEPI
ncbi:hypothetical protein Tco_0358288, partial [Tanacetum coccineum]